MVEMDLPPADRIRLSLFDDDSELLPFDTPAFPVTIEPCRKTMANFPRGQSFLDHCFALIETTSSAIYKASSIGWLPKKKKREMRHEDMMYLLVRRTETQTKPTQDTNADLPDPTKILGFLSFMYTKDDPPHADRDVVYIYEVHLAEELRGAGLGSHLVKIAERAAEKEGITKTMLTVFVSNEKARALYERLGYTKDECSPVDRETRGRIIKADYVIMSKDIKE